MFIRAFREILASPAIVEPLSRLLFVGANLAFHSFSFLTVSELERDLERSRALQGLRDQAEVAAPQQRTNDGTVRISGASPSKAEQLRTTSTATNQRISGGYFPSIIDESSISDEHLRAAKAAIVACGFEPTHCRLCPNVKRQCLYKWKVTLRTSATRSIQLHLDENQVNALPTSVEGRLVIPIPQISMNLVG